MNELEMTKNVNDKDDEVVFESFKKESAVDLVISNVKNLLISNKLNPGDKLPSEPELCKNMSVSRGSLREAMKILSAFGIVDIRRGDGTYITKTDNKIKFDPLLFSLIKSNADMNKYAELRKMMELEIVKLIVKNANEESIDNISRKYNEMEAAMKQGVMNSKIYAEYDLMFHAALGHATQNVLIEIIYNFVMDFFTPSIQHSHEIQTTGLNALRLHKKILDALIEKNMEKATIAIEESIDAWEKSIG